MERLSGLDASFLYLETPEQLMHVCGLFVLDTSTMSTPYDFRRMRDGVAASVSGVPTFTRRLKSVPLRLDHPVWVKDENFDIERHVHRLALPTPGGYDELVDLASHLAALPLDRRKPLWEMWVIEGYGEGKVAVMSKMHHATVDGVSGSSLISHLCSLHPDAAPLATADPEDVTGRTPSSRELLGRAVVSNLTRPLNAVKLVGPSVDGVVRTVDRVRSGTAMAAPLTAPRTSFNGTITAHRTLGFTDLELEAIKEVKSATGTTVNDVVLALSGGALRAYLEERGELPENSLLASVPVSVREQSKRSEGANKVSALFAKLGTDVEDPLERLEGLAERNAHAKEHADAISADALQDWAEFAAPRTFGLAVRAYAGLRLAERHPVVHNLVISNVPGPPVPLYFLGAQIVGLYPLGPVFHGAGLNITVMSNNGMVHVGVIAARESVPNVEALLRHFPDELARMREALARREGGVDDLARARAKREQPTS